MKFLPWIVLPITVLCLSAWQSAAPSPESAAQVAARKRVLAMAALEAMNHRGVAAESLRLALDSFRKLGMKEPFLKAFEQRFSLDEVMRQNAELYANELDEATLVALEQFYRSPEGQKLAAKMPRISSQGMARGQEYGQRIAEEVLQSK
jgi:Uncharacterized protein conserved in bacteria (DUF2059)